MKGGKSKRERGKEGERDREKEPLPALPSQ